MKRLFNDRKPLLITLGIMAILLVLPLTLVKLQRPQEVKTSANAATTLGFVEGTSLNTTVGSTIPLTVYVDPSTNLLSYLKLVVTYDPTKVKPVADTPFVVNTAVFPMLLSGPILSSNTITAEMAIGPDASRAISQKVNVATITFEAIGATKRSGTSVSLQNGTFALSLSTDTSADENVIVGTTPIKITISGGSKGGSGKGGGPKPH